MQVHTKDGQRVVFFLSSEDLTRYGVDGTHVDGDWTRRITLEALDEMGVSAGGRLEIEAFTGQGGVMIFASLSPAPSLETAFFLCDRFEHVCALCHMLKPPPPYSALARYQGRYLLIVSGHGQIMRRVGLIAAEFSRRLYRSATWAAALKEHGDIIVPEQAAEKLADL